MSMFEFAHHFKGAKITPGNSKSWKPQKILANSGSEAVSIFAMEF